MAGIKITDLPALASAEAGDYLCIVDVSDTSQSPEGTTKKIELGNVVESGTFSTTATAVTGFDTLILREGIFTRIGDTINYGFKIDFTLEPTGVGADQLGEFTIDFPQKVNNFNNVNYSFQLTVTETNPNTFNKSILDNGDLTATININSVGTGNFSTGGVLFVSAIYKV